MQMGISKSLEVPQRRLPKLIFLSRQVARNRAANEVKKLEPKGRTPPFRCLTFFFFCSAAVSLGIDVDFFTVSHLTMSSVVSSAEVLLHHRLAGLGSRSPEQRSLSFAKDVSKSKSELVGLCPGSLRCNSSTQRFIPRHITTQDVRFGFVVDGI